VNEIVGLIVGQGVVFLRILIENRRFGDVDLARFSRVLFPYLPYPRRFAIRERQIAAMSSFFMELTSPRSKNSASAKPFKEHSPMAKPAISMGRYDAWRLTAVVQPICQLSRDGGNCNVQREHLFARSKSLGPCVLHRCWQPLAVVVARLTSKPDGTSRNHH
jgi:hypothetical protein